MNKYSLTEEEINSVILNSPYSLSDNPSQRGLKAPQIKSFFYSFIRMLCNYLNSHTSELENDLEVSSGEVNGKIEELFTLLSAHDESELSHQGLISEIRGLISKGAEELLLHNEDEDAHQPIKSELYKELSSHNVSELSHSDIRQLIKNCYDLGENALSLATGKSKIIPKNNTLDMLDYIRENELFAGDVFILEEENTPNFTFFATLTEDEVANELSLGALPLDYEEYKAKKIELQIGKSYIFEGHKLLASECGFDVSTLAKSEELDKLSKRLNESIEETGASLTLVDRELSKREMKKEYIDTQENVIAVLSNKEYSLGLQTELTLALGEKRTDFEAIVNFRSGNVKTSFLCSEDVIFSGDDTLSGKLLPVSNRIYEVNIKNVGGVYIARVNATDYEVI